MDEKTIAHILNLLRKGTVTWHGRRECLARYRRKKFLRFGKSGYAIYKFEWRCGECNDWYDNEKDLEIDHIEEIGPFKGSFDVHIPRMYCAQENLQPLCIACHKRKTAKFTSALFRYQRKAI